MLDETSPVPLYHQLCGVIRTRIENGFWKAGEQLPIESEMCDEFRVSRATVRQAVQALVREGLIQRRRGRGSFAQAPRIHHDLLTFGSFAAYAEKKIGRALTNRILSVSLVAADAGLAATLGTAEGADLVEVRKVKLADGQPIFMAADHVPLEVCPSLIDDDHSTGTLIDLLQDKYQFRITRLKGSFEAVSVTAEEAELLDMEPGAPALLYHRVRYTMADRPLMASRHLIRTDMCELSFDSTAPSSR